MAIHLDFIKDSKQNYTFFDRHTEQMIAVGEYHDGEFLTIDIVGNTSSHVCAATAWTKLNQNLEREYGW